MANTSQDLPLQVDPKCRILPERRNLLEAEVEAAQAEQALADMLPLLLEFRTDQARLRPLEDQQLNQAVRAMEDYREAMERFRYRWVHLAGQAPGQVTVRGRAANRADNRDSSAWCALGKKTAPIAAPSMLEEQIRRLAWDFVEWDQVLKAPQIDQETRQRVADQVARARARLGPQIQLLQALLKERRSRMTRDERRQLRMTVHVAKKARQLGQVSGPEVAGEHLTRCLQARVQEAAPEEEAQVEQDLPPEVPPSTPPRELEASLLAALTNEQLAPTPKHPSQGLLLLAPQQGRISGPEAPEELLESGLQASLPTTPQAAPEVPVQEEPFDALPLALEAPISSAFEQTALGPAVLEPGYPTGSILVASGPLDRERLVRAGQLGLALALHPGQCQMLLSRFQLLLQEPWEGPWLGGFLPQPIATPEGGFLESFFHPAPDPKLAGLLLGAGFLQQGAELDDPSHGPLEQRVGRLQDWIQPGRGLAARLGFQFERIAAPRPATGLSTPSGSDPAVVSRPRRLWRIQLDRKPQPLAQGRAYPSDFPASVQPELQRLDRQWSRSQKGFKSMSSP